MLWFLGPAAHVIDRVQKLTDDRQHPFIPRLERFDPGLVLALTQ